MKHKPDAYELEDSGSSQHVIKCDCCGFKAVRCQFEEDGHCPSCKAKSKIIKGHYLKGGK